MINEYDQRQLKLILERLTWYSEGSISLPYLIDDLSGLLNVLEEVDEEWKMYFRRNWLDLEIVYAVALDRDKDKLDETDLRVINSAVVELKKMVISLLEESKLEG